MSTPRLEIHYCVKCKFLFRATWLAQELLSTFETTIGEIALVPRDDGAYEIRLDGEVLFAYKDEHRFPDAKEIRELVRDRIAPDRIVGHTRSRVSESL